MSTCGKYYETDFIFMQIGGEKQNGLIDEAFIIYVGDGTFGKKPAAGKIAMWYSATNGTLGNVSNTITSCLPCIFLSTDATVSSST